MTEKKSSKFEMRTDDESPDLQLRDQADTSQLEKLNKRMTRLSILIPCLMGAILVAAYFNIKTHLSQVNTTGTVGVQTLSKELESKFSSLSVREAALEESMEKTTAALQKSSEEASTAIRYIRSARKSDNQKTADSIEKIEKTLASMSKKLEKISSDLKSLDQALTNKMMK